MPERQFCTPHVVVDAVASPLARIPFDERKLKEDWFQSLLFNNPSLIPVDEIEPVFGPLIPLARELRTSNGGLIDLVYINPQGYLTLVETKLFRNPEARREVVAQIVDYAAALSQWSYGDLCNAVALNENIVREKGDPIVPRVYEHPDYNEARFIDTVTSNLERGRFLLLIVGDGIQSGVEHLADTLTRAPHLGFSLALLELALFRFGDQSAQYIVQPRVLARTREVVRAVVELRTGLSRADVRVSMPEAQHGEGAGERLRITDEVLIERVAVARDSDTAAQFRAFLVQVKELGVEFTGRTSDRMAFRWQGFSLGSVFDDGRVVFEWVLHDLDKRGLADSPGREYVKAVEQLIPDAAMHQERPRKKVELYVRIGNRDVTLADLMPKSAGWLAAMNEFIAKTELALEAKEAGRDV
jgi:hypothetical protein